MTQCSPAKQTTPAHDWLSLPLPDDDTIPLPTGKGGVALLSGPGVVVVAVLGSGRVGRKLHCISDLPSIHSSPSPQWMLVQDLCFCSGTQRTTGRRSSLARNRQTCPGFAAQIAARHWPVALYQDTSGLQILATLWFICWTRRWDNLFNTPSVFVALLFLASLNVASLGHVGSPEEEVR